jgi:predicted Holliday junction resolvase-like endonuclease
MDQIPPPLLLAFGLIIGALIGGVIMWVRHRLLLHSAITFASRKSVAQSRSTLKGQIAEQMAPLLPGFPYQPADARFIGDPVDYVVFNGYTRVKDGAADSESIELIILDIKHGQAKLSSRQRAIARAIEAGRVRFELVRITADGEVSVASVRCAA